MFDNMIAKEGHKKILLAFIAFIFFVLVECGLLALISFATFAFLIYVYRYKYVDVGALDKDSIYAPISGKVTAIDLKDLKRTIYIDVNLCDSHILRSIEDGDVTISLKRGLNLSLDSFKAKNLNERATVNYSSCSMQILSSMCNNSICFPNKTTFSKGEKIGTFLHGQIIISLSSEYETSVNIGDKILSGISVIAKKK